VTGTSRVLAVDLGATSIRVAAIDLHSDPPSVEVLHRWRNSPVTDTEGSLRWDWDGIVTHVEKGLSIGLELGPVHSIGVDGWGVDYALVTGSGELVDPPYAYRDNRTEGWETTADLIGVNRLYEITGVQLMGINTIFQLAADSRERLQAADKMLLLPDLLVNHLTGWMGVERTNLSTTGLMDARTGEWSDELITALSLPSTLFPEPHRATERAGYWKGIPVHLVGSHDTASAFLGMPAAGPDSIFVSTGSWVIVGLERPEPDTSVSALRSNFSNEAGALGGVRFLKNVVGFWILEQCRSEWGEPSMEDLMTEASQVTEPLPTFDASDHRFVSTSAMVREVRDATGLPDDAPRGVMARSVIESIVNGVAGVVDEIEAAVDVTAKRLVLVGGGSRIPLLADLLHRKSGLEVVVGSAEATALGNAVVQGIALGRFDTVAEAREWLTTGVAAA
jgi:rhamnulokinase